MTHLLIDGDILVYSAAFASQTTRYLVPYQEDEGQGVEIFQYKREAIVFAKEVGTDAQDIRPTVNSEPWVHCEWVAENMMQSYLRAVPGSTATTFLSEEGLSNSYRYALDNNYKQNRKGFEKPVHYKGMREWLVSKHDAKIVAGIEADDALGIHQTEDTMIVSKDKDVLQIPGYHMIMGGRDYDGGPIIIFVSDPGTLYLEKDKAGKPVLRGFGFKWFCAQMLTGDAVDNIKGIPRVGPVKAYAILKDEFRPAHLWRLVKKTYKDARLCPNINAQLLWILRSKDGYFNEHLVESLDSIYMGALHETV